MGKSVSGILNRYNFTRLVPGENQESYTFEGDGVVILCCETNKEPIQFKVLEAYHADHALEVAKRLLKHQRDDCDGKLFAMLARVPQKDRAAVVAEINKSHIGDIL